MPRDIELVDISQSAQPSQQQTSSDPDAGPAITNEAQDQTITVWAYASTVILLALAVPMILFPRFLLFVSATASENRNELTPLERYLALNGGILLFAFALALLFNIRSDSVIAEAQKAQGHPLLVPLTSACTLIAFISYNTSSVSSLAFLVFMGSAVIGAWGWWTVLFSGSSYRSRKTGADKRTSRFLFGNKSAASTQKKKWKKERAAQDT